MRACDDTVTCDSLLSPMVIISTRSANNKLFILYQTVESPNKFTLCCSHNSVVDPMAQNVRHNNSPHIAWSNLFVLCLSPFSHVSPP